MSLKKTSPRNKPSSGQAWWKSLNVEVRWMLCMATVHYLPQKPQAFCWSWVYVDKVSPTVYLCRKCLCRVYLHMFKGRRQGKEQWWDKGRLVEAFVTRTEGPFVALSWSAELQALDILSHTDPQFDPAVGMMDDHSPSMITPLREREHLWRGLLFWPLSLALLGEFCVEGQSPKQNYS